MQPHFAPAPRRSSLRYPEDAMSPYEILRLVVWLVGVPVIVWLCVRAARQVAAIRKLHEELLREEAASAQNPYAQMARLMEAQELLERAKRGK